MEEGAVEGPVECVSRDQIAQMLNEKDKSLWKSICINGVD